MGSMRGIQEIQLIFYFLDILCIGVYDIFPYSFKCIRSFMLYYLKSSSALTACWTSLHYSFTPITQLGSGTLHGGRGTGVVTASGSQVRRSNS